MPKNTDPRYVASVDARAVLRAWVNDADMGGWTDGDEDAFRAAVIAEAADGFGCEPEEVEEVTIKVVAEPLTSKMISDLRTEAAAAGDDATVRDCDAVNETAFGGEFALGAKNRICVVINNARAMDENTPFVRVVP